MVFVFYLHKSLFFKLHSFICKGLVRIWRNDFDTTITVRYAEQQSLASLALTWPVNSSYRLLRLSRLLLHSTEEKRFKIIKIIATYLLWVSYCVCFPFLLTHERLLFVFINTYLSCNIVAKLYSIVPYYANVHVFQYVVPAHIFIIGT